MIWVDADACPVVQEITQIAQRRSIEVCFVASYDHMRTSPTFGKWIYVDPGQDSADLYLLNRCKPLDIAITHDIGLASLLLAKRVYVIAPTGKVYTEETIDTALTMRYYSAKERRKGNYGKGPKKFTQEDKDRFVQSLDSLLNN